MVKVIVLAAATLALTACIAVPVPNGSRSYNDRHQVYTQPDSRDRRGNHDGYTRDRDGYYRDRDGNYRDRQGRYRDQYGNWHEGPH